MFRIDQALYELFAIQFYKVVCIQFGMWLIAIIIKNPSLIDVAWTFVHFMVGFLIATRSFSNFSRLSNPYLIIGLVMLGIWWLRLGGHILYHKVIHHHQDPRYTAMVEGYDLWKANFYYFIQFQFQGLYATVCCLTLYYIFILETKNFEIISYFGIALCIIGLCGESIADYQLQYWKDHKSPEEKIFRGGLFKNARHPNLFFELVFWVGMSLYGVTTSDLNTLCGFIGPFLLWAVMYFVTIPITTKHMMKSRPNYEQIISETNTFLPI